MLFSILFIWHVKVPIFMVRLLTDGFPPFCHKLVAAVRGYRTLRSAFENVVKALTRLWNWLDVQLAA